MNTRIFTLFLVGLLLSSCAKADVPSTPTLTPNPTATSIPSPTLTATATEDPLAGAPEGATGKNSNSEWTRTVEINGIKVEQIYALIKDKNGEVMYADWVRVKTTGDGIPILDHTKSDRYGYKQLGIIELLCSDKFTGCIDVPAFTHIGLIPENSNDSNVTSRSKVLIYQRLNHGNTPTGEDMFNFLNNHRTGIDINFFLTDPDHMLTWTMKPGPAPSAVEILTDWNDPLLEGADEYKFGSRVFRTKILGIDADGRLIGIAATENPLQLEDTYAWARLLFINPAMVLQQEDLSQKLKASSVLNDMVLAADQKSFQGNPWIILEPDN